VFKQKQMPPEHLTTLRERMVVRFSLEELRLLVFDLGENYDDLRGETISAKIQALLEHLEKRGHIPELLAALSEQRPNEDWNSVFPAEPDATSPYKGLQFFSEEDVSLFFGREQLTAELVAHLCQSRFLAVVGASGSGKSSVVRAGVVMAVRRGVLITDGGSHRDWSIHIMSPGDTPLKALAATLTRDSESLTAMKTLLTDLQSGTDSLDLFLYRHMSDRPHGRVLLVIDQFEELFTQCDDTEERRLFVENLVTAVSSRKQGPLSLIPVLRADFYAYAVQFESLRPLLETQQKIVGIMNQVELRMAITNPAEQNGWQLQPGLAETILQDVGREPGALPLLSHALQETWERREGRLMTLAGYQAAGGVRRAIAQTADTVYAGLSPEEQTIARNIFLRLTELGEGTEDTRRRASLAELIPQRDMETAVQTVLDLLAHKRLVTLNEERPQGNAAQTYAEVAHEALIREWPALREWLDENREGLRIHRQITEAAQAWQASGEDISYLFRGGRLAQAQEWVAGHTSELNAREHAFLQASQEHEATEQKRIAAIATERTRASRFLNIALFVANIFAVAFLIILLQSRNNLSEAIAQSRVAQSQALAAASVAVQAENPMRGLLLAIAAGQTAETAQAFDALNASLPRMARPLFTLIPGEKGYATLDLKWNNDESRILTMSHGRSIGEVRSWDATDGRLLLTLPHAGRAVLAEWNSKGSQILTVDSEGNARVWDAVNGDVLLTLSDDASVSTAVWNKSGDQILTASADGLANLWDEKSGAVLLTLTHMDSVQLAKWNSDESEILTSTNDGTVKVWDASSGIELFTLRYKSATYDDPAWNVSEDRILTRGEDGTVNVWDAATGNLKLTIPVSHEDLTSFRTKWNKDGSLILTWDIPHLEGTAKLWDASSGELLNMFQHNAGIEPQLNPDESQIMTGGGDGIVQIWDVQKGELILSLHHTDNVYEAQWNKDGSLILTNSEDGIVKVWDAVNGQTLYTFEHEGPAWEAKWNKEESQIIVASGGGITIHPSRIQVWEVHPNALLTIQKDVPVREALWSKDGSQILLRNANGTVEVFDSSTGKSLFTLTHDDNIFDAWWNENESQILTGSADGTAKLWDARTGNLLLTLPHDGPVDIAKWNEQGNLILTHTPDYKISRSALNIWSASDGVLLSTMSSSLVFDAEWNVKGDRVLASEIDGEVTVWNTQTGEVILSVPNEYYSVRESNWNNDETKILTSGGICYAIFNDSSSCHSTEAKVWDALSGESLLTLPHERSVWSAIWNGDESEILTSSSDGTAKLWDAETGDLLLTMAHDSYVSNAIWNDDESQILTWSGDGKARVWDAKMGTLLFTFSGDGQEINSANWNPDESRMLLATEGGLARVYYTKTGELLSQACLFADRNLTWSEWQLYLPNLPYRPICPSLPCASDIPENHLNSGACQP